RRDEMPQDLRLRRADDAHRKIKPGFGDRAEERVAGRLRDARVVAEIVDAVLSDAEIAARALVDRLAVVIKRGRPLVRGNHGLAPAEAVLVDVAAFGEAHEVVPAPPAQPAVVLAEVELVGGGSAD